MNALQAHNPLSANLSKSCGFPQADHDMLKVHGAIDLICWSLPCGDYSKECCQVIDGIFLAYAVVRSMAKGHEVLAKFHILLSFRAESIRIKFPGICEALHACT